MIDTAVAIDVLREGEMQLVGRLLGSTNHAMLGRVTRVCPPPEPPQTVEAVYKPIAGERPLDDFPNGTLGRREVAAFLVSEASGWGVVPPTVLRDGPFGEGAVQLWIDIDTTVDVVAMVIGDDRRLRRIAAFDAAVNNTDRKGGHLLPIDGGAHIYGVDMASRSRPIPSFARCSGAGAGRRSRRTSGTASSESRPRSGATWRGSWRRSCRGPKSRQRGGGSTNCLRWAAFRTREGTGRRSPAPRSERPPRLVRLADQPAIATGATGEIGVLLRRLVPLADHPAAEGPRPMSPAGLVRWLVRLADRRWPGRAPDAEPGLSQGTRKPGAEGNDAAAPWLSGRWQSAARRPRPMPQDAWSDKRERQYEHIKDSYKDRGISTDEAEERAARTVNKERAEHGETKSSKKR